MDCLAGCRLWGSAALPGELVRSKSRGLSHSDGSLALPLKRIGIIIASHYEAIRGRDAAVDLATKDVAPLFLG